MRKLYEETVNHCGNVLAHRGCIFSGPVRGTIAYCDTPNAALYFACPHRDPFQLSHKIPNRRMLPERVDNCVFQVPWWHKKKKQYDQYLEPLAVAARGEHVIRGESVEDVNDFGCAESSSEIIEEDGEKETSTR